MQNLEKLSVKALKELYVSESDKLHRSLLAGDSWKDTESQRNIVSAIGATIDLKMETFSTEPTKED